jgi:hypothetical protein
MEIRAVIARVSDLSVQVAITLRVTALSAYVPSVIAPIAIAWR